MNIAHSNTTSEGPIVVLVTPSGRGAVATVVVCGRDAAGHVGRWFRSATDRPLAEYPVGQIVYGRWGDGCRAGEEVVICRRPDQTVEVHCHGGRIAATAIVESLVAGGCRALSWQEWAAGSAADPLAADALLALASARTTRTAAVLLDQQRGALRHALERIIADLAAGAVEQAAAGLRELLRWSRLGLHLVEPWQVVLAGRPNVGKSSLINALLGFERSIVFDQPGTTRDVVTTHTSLGGWPVVLADTAGVRASAEEELEAAGVVLARRQISTADLVVLVFDASQSWSPADDEVLEATPSALVVHNKCDLPVVNAGRCAGWFTSAKTGLGVEPLSGEIVRRLLEEPPPGTAVPFCPHHVEAIRETLDSLAIGRHSAAIAHLRALVQPRNSPSS